MSASLRAAALALGLVAAACSQDARTGDAGGDQGGAEGQVTLDIKDRAFQPQVLEGEDGQTLAVAIHNEDSVPHTFTVDAQQVDVEIEPGGSAEAEVAIGAQPVEFRCRFHPGMTGQLAVAGQAEPPSPAGDTGGGGFDPYG